MIGLEVVILYQSWKIEKENQQMTQMDSKRYEMRLIRLWENVKDSKSTSK